MRHLNLAPQPLGAMVPSKKTGNKGKSAGNLNESESNTDCDPGSEPPQWAKDLMAHVASINSKVDLLWKKCDEIIDHVNRMDERRFETGRKLWNTLAETTSRINEKFLILHGIKLPGQTGVHTRTTAKTPSEKSVVTVEFIRKWFSEKLGTTPEIVNAEVFVNKDNNSVPPPIRIELKSKADRKLIFDNVNKLAKLKKKISICDDLPLAIRNIRKKMVNKLKELKKGGANVKFRGIDLISDGSVVPPPRPDYRKLKQLTDADKNAPTPEYHTDSDEFGTPEKHRQGRSDTAVEISPMGYEKFTAENSIQHCGSEDLSNSNSETDSEQEPAWFTEWRTGASLEELGGRIEKLRESLEKHDF